MGFSNEWLEGLSQNFVITFGCHSKFCKNLPGPVAAVISSC